MTTYNQQSQARAQYGTGSHNEGLTFFDRNSSVAHQMKWADFHPPGKRVLPKGHEGAYDPATEVRWEDTLGGKFALALKKLEGLLYAAFGSRPRFKEDGVACQWYDAPHPRCLWGPEIWGREFSNAVAGCEPWNNPGENCYEFMNQDMEYAALGDIPSPLAFDPPTVPIRTRTTDVTQVSAGDEFPLGSITITNENGDPFFDNHDDPKGYGWFGATYPGRQDTPGWMTNAHGYTRVLPNQHPSYPYADKVKITYTKPPGVEPPDFVTIYYRERASADDAWGSWQTNTLSNAGGGVYVYEFDRQPHGHQVMWYLEYKRDATPFDIYRYAPGSEVWPGNAEQHLFRIEWCTHFNPYKHGLPEMLDAYPCGDNGEEIDIRHGTDTYEFDGSETIQPELLNLVRFTISWLGGRNCAIKEGCAETSTPFNHYHHNPKLLRAHSLVLCCAYAPIHFYWSGSNTYPLYRQGGKGNSNPDAIGTFPLVNWPDIPEGNTTYGSEAARRSWRGTWQLFKEMIDNTGEDPEVVFSNKYFGAGVSWGTPPGETVLFHAPTADPLSQPSVTTDYHDIGLQPGDVIDSVHIQEIIDAVDYLIDYGLWEHTEVCTKRKTPSGFTWLGYSCGHGSSTGNKIYRQDEDCWGNPCQEDSETFEWRRCYCQGCCDNRYGADNQDVICIEEGNDGLGCCFSDGWHVDDWNGNDPPCADPGVAFNITDGTCQPTTVPADADPETFCRQYVSGEDRWICLHEKCHGLLSKAAGTTLDVNECTCLESNDYKSWKIHCDSTISEVELPHEFGGGHHRNDFEYREENSTMKSCYRQVDPMSFYMCTPGRCHQDGWDDNHGNNFDKTRYVLNAQGDNFDEISDLYHSGNCWGDLFACGDIYDVGWDFWFSAIVAIDFPGIVPHWIQGCNDYWGEGGDNGQAGHWPDPVIEGFGNIIYDLNGEYVKTVCENSYSEFWNGYYEDHDCKCKLADVLPIEGICDYNNDKIWVAVNLNLDNTDRPYRKYTGIDGNLPPYTGDGVPVLHPYDLTQDPEEVAYVCTAYTAEMTANDLIDPLG